MSTVPSPRCSTIAHTSERFRCSTRLPCCPIYAALRTLRYYKQLGGIDELHRRDIEKAAYLYDAIDNSRMFVGTVTDPADRSIMNVTFVMTPEYKELEGAFVDFCADRGIVGIKVTVRWAASVRRSTTHSPSKV